MQLVLVVLDDATLKNDEWRGTGWCALSQSDDFVRLVGSVLDT